MPEKTKCFFFIIMFYCANVSFAQETYSFSDNLYVQARYHYGFILPHTTTIAYSVTDRFPGMEINISKPTYGSDFYDQLYRYPRIGIGYFNCSFRDKNIFGTAHGIYPFINVPVTKEEKLWLNYRIAFGLSYLDKTFDIAENTLDVAIGSHGNIFFNFCFDAKYKVFRYHELTGSVGIIHFSNGNFKKPNLGINYISCSAGINVNLNPEERKKKYVSPPEKDKYEWDIIYSAGWRTYDLHHNNLEFASSLSANVGRFLNYKRRIGLGADIFYNEVLKYDISPQNYEDVSIFDKTQYGVYVFHDMKYRRLVLLMQLGAYVYAKYKQQPIYTRIGIRYHLNDFLLANLSLKTHYANADFVEFGIGYYIRK